MYEHEVDVPGLQAAPLVGLEAGQPGAQPGSLKLHAPEAQ